MALRPCFTASFILFAGSFGVIEPRPGGNWEHPHHRSPIRELSLNWRYNRIYLCVIWERNYLNVAVSNSKRPFVACTFWLYSPYGRNKVSYNHLLGAILNHLFLLDGIWIRFRFDVKVRHTPADSRSSVAARMAAFQAVDPGSTPGTRRQSIWAAFLRCRTTTPASAFLDNDRWRDDARACPPVCLC